MSKKTLSIAAAILALSTTAYADNYKRGSNQTHYKYAKVVDVEPIHQNIRYYEPTRTCPYERCATIGNNNTTSVIVGSFLVAAIGTGSIIAGYLYPNTGEELTNAVEKYEEK